MALERGAKLPTVNPNQPPSVRQHFTKVRRLKRGQREVLEAARSLQHACGYLLESPAYRLGNSGREAINEAWTILDSAKKEVLAGLGELR